MEARRARGRSLDAIRVARELLLSREGEVDAEPMRRMRRGGCATDPPRPVACAASTLPEGRGPAGTPPTAFHASRPARPDGRPGTRAADAVEARASRSARRPGAARESRAEQIDLVFDNNRLASALYGEFDQNLALIERRLGVDARARGNMVTLRGPPHRAGARAARAGIALRPAARRATTCVQGDVEGAIRMAEAEEAQLPLPTLDELRPHAARAHRDAEKIRRGAHADAGRLYPRHGPLRARLRHRPGRHRKNLSRGGARRGDAGARRRRNASSCRARRSRRASGSAFCPAT